MARILWKRLNQTDFNAMSGAAAISPTGGGARHIVLGTSKPGNRVESFLPPLKGYHVTVTTEAGVRWPKASLTFSSNPERRNGEWLIADQKNNRHPAWTAAAGFPTTFDTANRPVVLVLEIDGTYYVDWRDERSLHTVAPLIASRERGVDGAPPELVAELLLQPELSPVDAQVVGGLLQYVDTTKAQAASSDNIVDTVRMAHLSTAERLTTYLAGSNVGPSFGARFEAVHDLLRRALTSERALQLAVHVRGLEGMMGVIAERLDEVTVADIAIFISDLMDLLNQLPAYRRFVEEARAAITPTADAMSAATTVVLEIEKQPDDLVASQLKQAMREVRVVAEETNDRLTAFALLRTAGNVFRAVSRFFNGQIARVAGEAAQTFKDNVGKDFGNAMSKLVVTASVAGALKLLHSLFPGEFAFVGQLLRAAAALIF